MHIFEELWLNSEAWGGDGRGRHMHCIALRLPMWQNTYITSTALTAYTNLGIVLCMQIYIYWQQKSRPQSHPPRLRLVGKRIGRVGR